MVVHLIGRRFQFDSIVHDCVIAALAAGVGVGRRLQGASLERLAIGVDVIALRQRVLRAKQTIRRLIAAATNVYSRCHGDHNWKPFRFRREFLGSDFF